MNICEYLCQSVCHFKKDGAKRHQQIFNLQSSIFNSGLPGVGGIKNVLERDFENQYLYCRGLFAYLAVYSRHDSPGGGGSDVGGCEIY